MKQIQQFLATPEGGMVRIFVGLVLGYLVVALQNRDSISLSLLSTWAGAALVVVIPLAIAYINPADSRFGRGA